MSNLVNIAVKVQKETEEFSFSYERTASFFQELCKALDAKGLSYSLCGGKGSCEKCIIRFIDQPPLPTGADRRRFSPEELRQGWRLACKANPTRDCTIEVSFVYQEVIPIVTENALTQDVKNGVETAQNDGKEYLVAVDIGTTTVAMVLRDVRTGEVRDTYAVLNPQRAFGADVISRIQAAGEGEGKRLKQSIMSALEKGVSGFRHLLERQNPDGRENIAGIYIAANTTMGHLLLGLDTSLLGKKPFTPVSLQREEFIIGGIKAVVLPGISAFVGADITAGLLAVGMLGEGSSKKKELFIDLGTNGEMVLFNGQTFFCTATAGGPAFEGSMKKPILGSNLIKLAAKMLREKIMDSTGLLVKPYFEKGYEAGELLITQAEIRKLQMAKAATKAGIKLLLEAGNINESEVETVYLAGGFGYQIEPADAVKMGLFPEGLETKVRTVGNTALEGAYLYGVKEQSLHGEKVTYFDIEKMQVLNLAEQEKFEEYYIESINFPT